MVCATIIGSGLMGRAGVAYSSGFKAIMTALPYLLGMFIFSGISGRISDIGVQYNIGSIPSLFERRFGREAKRGMFLGTAVYGVTIFLVFFMGIVAHQIIGDDVLAQYGTTDAVVPALAIRVLPIGLTGLAMAGTLSVIMSTADSYLLVSVQTCVNDIGATLRPEMSDRTQMRLNRLFLVLLPLGALVIALYIKNAYNILMFAWNFYAASAGLPAFAALYCRKATKQGIIAGILSGFIVCVGWKLIGEPFGLGSTVPGTIACTVALVGVSLATYKRSPGVFLEPTATEAAK